MEVKEILDFWFNELKPEQQFIKDKQVDETMVKRFTHILQAASCCELYHWRKTAEGRLAEIIILDQFSRNIYRGKPQSFSQDPLALVLAQELISHNIDKECPIEQRRFIYMPFMHSESALIHDTAVDLFSIAGLEDALKYELLHKKIIDRFNRYPHRNEILGRKSTEKEETFLLEPNSSF